MKADLHVHTCFSDGDQSPEEIAALANEKGLAFISVCDHNTVAAYPRLKAACAKEGVGLIRGAEISTSWHNRDTHLLAYDFDAENGEMLGLLQRARRELDGLDDDLARNMAEDFPEIDLQEYGTYARPPGRGGWKSINYIFDKGLSENILDSMKYFAKYARREADFPDIAWACRVIKAAGGVPVAAHPGVWGSEEPAALFARLAELKALGVEGFECHYPLHSADFTRMCVDFCLENNMYITCGGDCHGEFARYSAEADRYLGVMDVDMKDLRLWPGFGEK
ncbi:MAG: PHP domain-containing protein [Firmicutes bacterium]|nr:PHP domain-containing protein [Bacillota bacterium]